MSRSERRWPLDRTTRAAIYLLLLGAATLFLAPLLWMASTAFKEARLIYAAPPVWVAWPPTLVNFRQAWRLLPFLTYLRNSVFVACLSVPGAVLASSLAGYAFASLPARGRSFWFGILLGTLAVPIPATIIPTFLLFAKLGWVNTYLPLVVPQWAGGAAYIFLFRQFFRRLPGELYDSATLDGCSPAGVYGRIAMPLARPIIATVGAFAFAATWNDFLGPLIYLTDNARYTVPLGLALFQGRFYAQLQYMMPLSLLSLLPILVVYLLVQRHIVAATRLQAGIW